MRELADAERVESVEVQKKRYLCVTCKYCNHMHFYTSANKRPDIKCGKWFMPGTAVEVCKYYENKG